MAKIVHRTMMKVVAVIVTFNRLELLKACVNSVRDQTRKVDQIIVVNNGSTDNTLEWVTEQKDILTFTQRNLGGAGGFHRGILESFSLGFEWIWVMDDDCYLSPSCLEHMVRSKAFADYDCIAPVVKNKKNEVDLTHRGYFDYSFKGDGIIKPIDQLNLTNDLYVDFASFVGLMINSKAVDMIGLPKKEFFIHNDDIEYCFKLNKVSKILLCNNAIIHHMEDAKNININKKFLGFSNDRIPIDKLWIKYYGARNSIWIKKNYMLKNSRFKKLKLIVLLLKSLSKHIQEIIFYDDKKYRRTIFYMNAYYDGWIGNFDNTKPKKILY